MLCVVSRTRRDARSDPRRVEIGKALVPRDLDVGQIVEAGPPQGAVGHVEPRRSDHVHGDAQAGGQAQNGAGVLRDIGLVERQAHGADT